MKIAPFVLILALASCTKTADRHSELSTTTNNASADRKIEACNFGLQSFNKTRRVGTEEVYVERGRPKNNQEQQAVSMADATILVDFNGTTVDGTVWNSGSPIICAPSNLSAQEKEKILMRVSEDYSPFNVVVTTDESIYNETNPARRMRVVVTESWEWYGMVGGIAYYDSFTWGNNTPCFVFSTLLAYNEKYIAEAISHEVGHTLGLRHQASYSNSCGMLSEYNEGGGSGETGWAPIMGIAYYQNMTTWHKGSIDAGCGVVQDDVATLASILGMKQDNNLSFAKNTELTSGTEGILVSPTDIDYYFVDLKNPATLNAAPYCIGNSVGANLHLQINVYSKQGTLVSSYSSPATLAASTPLPKGKYYIGIETVANAGQSRYGMLGRYRLMLN